jgi:hypothetical protein
MLKLEKIICKFKLGLAHKHLLPLPDVLLVRVNVFLVLVLRIIFVILEKLEGRSA